MVAAIVNEVTASNSGTIAQCTAQTREPTAPRRSRKWRKERFMGAKYDFREGYIVTIGII